MARPQGSECDDFLKELLGRYERLSTSEIEEIIDTQSDFNWETVRNALDRLVERGELDILEQGRGRRPTLYGMPEVFSPDAYDPAPLDGLPDECDDGSANSGYSWGNSEHE